MSATANKNCNYFQVGDKAIMNLKTHFLYKQKGVINYVHENSVGIKLNCGVELITSFGNLRKLK